MCNCLYFRWVLFLIYLYEISTRNFKHVLDSVQNLHWQVEFSSAEQFSHQLKNSPPLVMAAQGGRSPRNYSLSPDWGLLGIWQLHSPEEGRSLRYPVTPGLNDTARSHRMPSVSVQHGWPQLVSMPPEPRSTITCCNWRRWEPAAGFPSGCIHCTTCPPPLASSQLHSQSSTNINEHNYDFKWLNVSWGFGQNVIANSWGYKKEQAAHLRTGFLSKETWLSVKFP